MACHRQFGNAVRAKIRKGVVIVGNENGMDGFGSNRKTHSTTIVYARTCTSASLQFVRNSYNSSKSSVATRSMRIKPKNYVCVSTNRLIEMGMNDR